MALLRYRCEGCGANLQYEYGGRLKCSYCGTDYLDEKHASGGDENILEKLLDPKNTDDITLQGSQGELRFKQVALIPFKNELYVILKPITRIKGINSNEAICFLLDIAGESLDIVDDQNLIDALFEKYNKDCF